MKHKSINNNVSFIYKHCLIGAILSIVLTIIPFFMVIQESARRNVLITVIFICGLIQIIIHLVYFLNINILSIENKWNLVALIFTLTIISILVTGSLWIMHHLKYNLMC